jgi:isoleucyl-tRNA synthetase
MPKVENLNSDLENAFDEFMELREDVLKALENARNEKVIGKSLNAHVIIYPKAKIENVLNKINVNLAQIFIVSRFDVVKDGFGAYKGQDVTIDVLKAEGHTCERCWQVVPHVDHDGLCERCQTVVAE